MKIRIRPNDFVFPLTFHLPLWMIKTRLSARIIAELMHEDAPDEEVEAVREQIKKVYATIKAYVKKHGHFYLVDIASSDGDRIYVRV